MPYLNNDHLVHYCWILPSEMTISWCFCRMSSILQFSWCCTYKGAILCRSPSVAPEKKTPPNTVFLQIIIYICYTHTFIYMQNKLWGCQSCRLGLHYFFTWVKSWLIKWTNRHRSSRTRRERCLIMMLSLICPTGLRYSHFAADIWCRPAH